MKLIDKYILSRYLLTFTALILLFIPIGILIDLSEKINRITQSKASQSEIINYYLSFSMYYADLLFPIFLFISIIWFTSKMAQNTEIIPILCSGVSFTRLLKPYLLGAFVVGLLIFSLEMFVVPRASKNYQDFTYKYISRGKAQQISHIYNQINDNEFVYVSSYNPSSKKGYNFTLEHFEADQLKFKISALNIAWIDTLGIYRMKGYKRRDVGLLDDNLQIENTRDTIFPFKIGDLSPVSYVAETKTFLELNNFIKKEKKRGSPNINRYLLVAYKRWTMPITTLILTFIAVAVSSKKKRGGLGLNLSFGMAVAFIYVFFDKIFGVLVSNSSFSPLLAITIPNFIFGVFSFYMIKKVKQ